MFKAARPTDVGSASEPLGVLADEELMQLVYKGAAHAFEVIYDRHAEAAFSLALRICGQRALAEDVTQEAFLSLWRSRARYDRGRGSVRTWVLGIVHNRAIDAVRRRGVRDRGVVHDEAIEAQLPAAERTDLEVARREEAREVRDALEQLPAGAEPRDRARLLRRPDTRRDRLAAGYAGWHREGTHATRPGEDALVPRPSRGGDAMSAPAGTGAPDAFYEDAGAYVLGALTDDEHARFSAHLKGCAACREEVARLQVVADALPAGGAPAERPPGAQAADHERGRRAGRRGRSRPGRGRTAGAGAHVPGGARNGTRRGAGRSARSARWRRRRS